MEKNFSERLAKARKSKNLTQEALSKLSKLNKDSIRRYEKAKNEPNAEQLIALSKALDLTTDYLLLLSHEPTKYYENNKEEIKTTISERIVEFKNLNNYTYKQLEELSTVDSTAIYRYVKKERKPDMNEIVKLARGFKMTSDYLLGLTDENRFK